jgi:RNA polymerase sigma factor (sigma-70 family)
MNQIIDITNGLDKLLALERSRLVGLCARLTGDAGVAEDLAQETMLEAWRHLHELRDHEKFSAWLSGIARNICLRWRRKHGQDAAHILPSISSSLVESGAVPTFLELEQLLPDTLDLEVALERKELPARLFPPMRSLRQRFRPAELQLGIARIPNTIYAGSSSFPARSSTHPTIASTRS